MKKIAYILLPALIAGCDSTTPEQVATACSNTGIEGYTAEYCECAASASAPSQKLVMYFESLSDVRKRVVSKNSGTVLNGLNVTPVGYQIDDSTVCEREASSSKTSVSSIPTEVICLTVDDDMNMVETSDPDVCGRPTAPEVPDMPILYEYGCSYSNAPDDQLFLTLEASIANKTSESLLVLQKEAGNSVDLNYQNDPTFAAMSNDASAVFAGENAAVDMMNYALFKQVKDIGTFSFGNLVISDPDSGRVETKSDVVNHDRYDFFGASSTVDAGASVLSAVAFMVPKNFGGNYFWKGSGEEIVNLDSIPVTYDLLEALFPQQIISTNATLPDDELEQVTGSCTLEASKSNNQDALELL